MVSIFNIEYEKQILSAIIRNPLLLSDIPLLEDNDFGSTNKIVFQVIKNLINKGTAVNKFIVIETLKNLNVKIADVIDPAVYMNSLELLDISDEEAVSISKELRKVTIRRSFYEMTFEIQKTVEKDNGKDAIEIVSDVNQIFNKKVNIISNDTDEDNEPKPLFGDVEDYINELGKNPHLDGIPSPFKYYQSLYGDFYSNSCSIFIARPKTGKSLWLMNLLMKCALLDVNNEYRFLLLDTEMTRRQVQRRGVTSMSQVGDYFIRTGFYKNNQGMVDNVNNSFKVFNKIKCQIDYVGIRNKTIDEQTSIVNRWYSKNILGKNKKACIALDYLKLSHADMDGLSKIKDYQFIGHKIEKWQDCIEPMKCPFLCAGQMNRALEGTDQQLVDSRVVGVSDEINKLFSNIYALQKLTVDQQIMLGVNDATHSLHSIYQREAGPNPDFELVKYKDMKGTTKYTENFILYKMKDFGVEEIYDFREHLKKNNIVNIDISNNKDIKKDLF